MIAIIFITTQNADAVQYLPLWDKSGYKIDEYGTITVEDNQQNTNMQIKNSIFVTVTSDSFSKGITISLLETEINSGVFSGKIRFSSEINTQNSVFVNENDFVHVVYKSYSNSAKIEPRTVVVSPITVESDKGGYSFGEKIIISGKVSDAIPGSTIVLSVVNPTGKIIHTQSIALNYEKRFVTELTTDSSLWETSGNYVIKIVSQSNAVEIAFSFSTTHHPEKITKSVKIFGTAQNLGYSITSGTVSLAMPNENTNSLRLSLNTKSGGHLSVVLPRTLIDAKTTHDEDADFKVYSDDQKTEYVEKIGPNERTLTIPFSYKTKSIEIVGTNLELIKNFPNKPTAPVVPSWIQNNAEWWSKGLITDSDYVNSIIFLTKKGYLTV